MSLLDFLRSDPKLWRVGSHRVKKVRRKKTDWNNHNHYTRKVTKYKCVDCERVRENRGDFWKNDVKCYEVINAD